MQSSFSSSTMRAVTIAGALTLGGCTSDDAATPASPKPLTTNPAPADGSKMADPPAAPAFDSLPDVARGPAIPPAGYLVQELKDHLYFITDGIYSCLFLTTGSGVVVVDVPQTFAPHLLD